MKRTLSICGILFAIVLAFSLVCPGPSVVSADEKVSMPGEYSGYSPELYDGWQRFSQYVEVRDGTKLAMDFYRPTLGVELVETPLPVIFQFTPYRRALYIRDSGGNIIRTYLAGASYADYFAKYGYVIAIADCRGTNASYGTRIAPNDATEAEDAHDLVEWLAVQPWCDGNVGMYGCSYPGGCAHGAIRNMPSGLKAAFISADFNSYDTKVTNGVQRGPSSDPSYLDDLPRAVPVDGDTDGDGDGYPDMMYEAIMCHQYNPPQIPFFTTIPYRNSWSDLTGSYYWEEVSASNYLDEIAQSGVAVYLYAGWYELLRRETVMFYTNWPNPKKMLIGPWPHCGSVSDFNLKTEMHRFLDYWLKGIDNGIMAEPPIYFGTEHAPGVYEWQFASEWPPPDQEPVTYFFEAGPSGSAPSINDGLLTTTSPTGVGDKDDYTTVYDIDTSTDWYSGRPRPTGDELDQKGLTYTTEPLEADMEVRGHAMVNLWFSSTATDAAFFVTMEDVDPSGDSLYVGDGRLRASMRGTYEPPFDYLDIPWHRCYQEDEQMLVPGEMVELEIDMLPTSYVFQEGHRIRLVITNSMGGWYLNFPIFDPPPVVSVYRDAEYPSFVSLPVIPAKPTAFEGTVKVKADSKGYDEVPAELYTFETAVYLHFDDQWLKWDTTAHWQEGMVEHYKCEGELGKLSVLVQTNDNASFEVLASGQGVHFKGFAQ